MCRCTLRYQSGFSELIQRVQDHSFRGTSYSSGTTRSTVKTMMTVQTDENRTCKGGVRVNETHSSNILNAWTRHNEMLLRVRSSWGHSRIPNKVWSLLSFIPESLSVKGTTEKKRKHLKTVSDS